MNPKIVAKSFWFVTALYLAGCSTYQASWDNRVGVFTYTQAIKELGPPDKKETLSDGRSLVQWISRYHSAGAISADNGQGFYDQSVGLGMVQAAPVFQESKLSLTFTTNHLLSAWSKN